MARFSVHDLPGGVRVVNLQSDVLDWLDTRLVAPLVPQDTSPPPAEILNPVVEMEEGPFVLLPQATAAVPVSELGDAIGDLSAYRDEIVRAIDMVLQGF
jgi:toxin CcdB